MVDRHLLDRMFPESRDYQLISALLAAQGRRPDLSAEEQLKRFCDENGLRCWTDLEHNRMVFESGS